MKKSHLSVAVVAVLALSSSTVASAEGSSHRSDTRPGHSRLVAPIGLSNSVGVLMVDTSTATPSFHFDTTTVTPHIDFDTSTVTTHFDTSTATDFLDDEPGMGDDDSLPGMGDDDAMPGFSPFNHGHSTNATIPPAAPGTPPSTWITKPQAKSNDDGDHSDHSSEDSQD